MIMLLYKNHPYPDILRIIIYIFSKHFRLAFLIEMFRISGLDSSIYVNKLYIYIYIYIPPPHGCSIFPLALNKKPSFTSDL